MLATLNRHPAIWAGIPGAVLIWLLAAAVIDHPVHYDELLHLLAARGLLGTGEPVIASGLYERAEVFTRMVSWSLSAFGSDPVSARIPAVFWAGVLVWLTGAWVAARAGRGATQMVLVPPPGEGDGACTLDACMAELPSS